jgi:probable HAF family extracellular repeat protein
VVGKAKNSAGSYKAFLWIPGRGMIDLNTKIPSGATGWVLASRREHQ